jgi:SpoVK/Ycf46/Vps4 family AAA+-type ATPase
MEDYGWSGLLAFGCPGAGKSLYSKGLAHTFDRPSLCLDMGACKGGLVGESETRIRDAMRVVRAIGGDGVFCVATANRLDTIPGELKRRFRYGIWMFDFPDQAQREKIWPIHLGKFGFPLDTPRPDDSLYAGSDIRNVCELAWRTGKGIKEEARFVGPVGKVSAEVIRDARKLADGRFLDATTGGLYSSVAKQGGRKVEV